ncbi:SLAC1 anion channel family protein [Arcobacter sp. FWKO B]|uniref:SLAC1 anion channel family protein n=1 Tax=Arcobacter sp. FWKO B TaxID=2593672 RepID=UPI0018A34AB5|nr:SLAC1 anion channel family protein [Arcobacter sp. FWKO B]QOG12393.1 C4-dicarboxylate ABC transporter [Arcobacter sp. FWKO B]
MDNTNHSRLAHFPIPLFAVVMGIMGLVIVYQKASHAFGFSSIIASIMVVFGIGIFIVFGMLYVAKLIKYPDEVKKEFNHPIRLNFFPAISICLLLISIALSEYSELASMVLWYIGAILHLFFTLYVIRYWIVNNLAIEHSNPAWFIPIVGNVIVPIMGVNYANSEISIFFFSIGMFFWFVLFTIILNRIIFHHQLAAKFLPTLFIFIAPAGVGFLSYVKIMTSLNNGVFTLDLFGHFIYDIGFFFTLLLLFMFREFMKVSFAITWWAYTFPLAAITLATILRYELTSSYTTYIIAHILIAVTTFVVAIVAYKSIKAALNKEICIKE